MLAHTGNFQGYLRLDRCTGCAKSGLHRTPTYVDSPNLNTLKQTWKLHHYSHNIEHLHSLLLYLSLLYFCILKLLIHIWTPAVPQSPLLHTSWLIMREMYTMGCSVTGTLAIISLNCNLVHGGTNGHDMLGTRPFVLYREVILSLEVANVCWEKLGPHSVSFIVSFFGGSTYAFICTHQGGEWH